MTPILSTAAFLPLPGLFTTIPEKFGSSSKGRLPMLHHWVGRCSPLRGSLLTAASSHILNADLSISFLIYSFFLPSSLTLPDLPLGVIVRILNSKVRAAHAVH
jgi:hypothetical protein